MQICTSGFEHYFAYPEKLVTLRSTLAPGGVTTSMTYDKNGNRLTISDPSSGITTNTWYGMGQPKTQQNGRGETTTYTYQADGLLDYYTASPDGEGQTNYTYNDKKQVSNITSPGGVSRTYTYDTKGRVSAIAESIDGVSNEVSYSYDAKGRLYRKYFNGTSDYEQYDYDANSGYLYRIQFNGVTVWELTAMDEYLRTRQANIGTTSASWTYDGNNLLSQVAATGVQRYDYSFDVNTGNLISRSNYLKAKTDSFGYSTDNLDKLISVKGPVNLSLTYTADKNGNILTKGDAGTYAYDDTPYAVSSIANGQNMSATPQDISYYSFEKVKNITEGTKSAEFVYNADQQRIRMVLKTNQTATKTRWYFGGSCERELAGGVTTQYIWIGGDAYSAKAVVKKVGTGAWTVYNIFRDHLGTITHLKDATTGTVTEYSFDAWGRRRDKDDWTMTLTSEPALFADRGFTGHEYLEDFKLYNMNGRLYDPVVGRFLNADPAIQDPGNTQNYNRYSYCLNNPLKYTDPSGMIHSHYWLKNQEDGIGGGPSDGGGGGSLTPHLDRARELSMAQDASLGWRYDQESNGYYNLFTYETGWNAAFNPISSLGTHLPGNANVSSIFLGNRNGKSGVWYQTVDLVGNYHDWIDGVNSPNSWVGVKNKFIVDSNNSRNIDWSGVTNATVELIGGVAEMAVGGAATYFSGGTATMISGPLMLDGGARTVANAQRLWMYFNGNASLADTFPTSLGALAGKGIDMAFGTSAYDVGFGQAIFGWGNDLTSFVVMGGNGLAWGELLKSPSLSNGLNVGFSLFSYPYSMYNNAPNK